MASSWNLILLTFCCRVENYCQNFNPLLSQGLQKWYSKELIQFAKKLFSFSKKHMLLAARKEIKFVYAVIFLSWNAN